MRQRDHGLVVTIGEAMAVMTSVDLGASTGAQSFEATVGGAEFNAAASLGRMGVPTAWVSRVGDDAFGARILREAADSLDDTDGVEIDASRPTGLYIKETVRDGAALHSKMRYYRSGSAASVMGAESLGTPLMIRRLAGARVVHVSGVTPALSIATGRALAGLRHRLGGSTTLSVDLNLRPALWIGGDRRPLDALIDQADLLFAGTDEALAHFGHADPSRLLHEHPRLRTLVLKDDARTASSHVRTTSGVEHDVVPALRVSVLEPIGAGDAFAAGYLAAMLDGASEVARLRTGHALAALALISPTDRPEAVPDPPQRALITNTPAWETWEVASDSIPWETRR